MKGANTLYVCASNSIPQTKSDVDDGRTFGVIYAGQAMMPTCRDASRAMKLAEEISRNTRSPIEFWDGDLGKFVESLEELKNKN